MGNNGGDANLQDFEDLEEGGYDEDYQGGSFVTDDESAYSEEVSSSEAEGAEMDAESSDGDNQTEVGKEGATCEECGGTIRRTLENRVINHVNSVADRRLEAESSASATLEQNEAEGEGSDATLN